MKILKQGTTLLRNASGVLLKVREDSYVYPDPNVFMVEVAVLSNTVITLPHISGYTHTYTVDLGDGSATGTVTTYNDVACTHTYAIKGTYVIRITGTCQTFYVNNGALELAAPWKIGNNLYQEFVFTGTDITQINYWSDATKAVKLFTKNSSNGLSTSGKEIKNIILNCVPTFLKEHYICSSLKAKKVWQHFKSQANY